MKRIILAAPAAGAVPNDRSWPEADIRACQD